MTKIPFKLNYSRHSHRLLSRKPAFGTAHADPVTKLALVHVSSSASAPISVLLQSTQLLQFRYLHPLQSPVSSLSLGDSLILDFTLPGQPPGY